MIELNGLEFKYNLEKIKPSLATTSVVHSHTMIHMSFNGSEYTITTNNGLSQLSATGEYSGEDSFNICVSGEKLNLISKSFKDSIKVFIKENELCINHRKSKYKLKTLSAETFPIMNFSGDSFIYHDISELIGNVSECAPVNDTRQYLCSVCMESDGDKVSSVGTSGYELGLKQTEASMAVFNIVIPIKSAKYLTNIKSYYFLISDEKLIVGYENVIFITKLMSEKYPAWRNILGKYNYKCTVNLSSLIDMVVLSSNLCTNGKANITVSNNVMTLRSSDNNNSILAEIDVEGDDMSFVINPKILINGLRMSDKETIELSFSGETGRIGYDDGVHTFVTSSLKE